MVYFRGFSLSLSRAIKYQKPQINHSDPSIILWSVFTGVHVMQAAGCFAFRVSREQKTERDFRLFFHGFYTLVFDCPENVAHRRCQSSASERRCLDQITFLSQYEFILSLRSFFSIFTPRISAFCLSLFSCLACVRLHTPL